MPHRFDLRIRRFRIRRPTAVLPLTLRGNHASLSTPASDSSRNGRLLHRHFTRAECRAPPTLAFLPAMCTRLRPEHNRQAEVALIRQPKRHDAALTSLRSVYNVNAVAPVAQWIEHFSPKEGVVGSIPIWGTFSYLPYRRIRIDATSGTTSPLTRHNAQGAPSGFGQRHTARSIPQHQHRFLRFVRFGRAFAFQQLQRLICGDAT